MDDYNLPGSFNVARTARARSFHKRPMGAAISRKGIPVCWGNNKKKTHPVFSNGKEFYSIHAEMDALIHYRGEIMGDAIWVYREVNGQPAMAKPCKFCLKHIIEAGIRTIYYTVPNAPYYERVDL